MGNPFDDAKLLIQGKEVNLDQGALFIINRILSFNPGTFLFSKQMNEISGKINAHWLKKVFSLVPKSNIRFLRYAKKKKEKEPKLVEAIAKHFCCSKYHADQIIDLIRLKGEKPETMFGLKEGE